MGKFIPIFGLGLVLLCSAAAAQLESKVQALTAVDREFMEGQRQRIDQLARSGLGRQVTGSRENDIDVLQLLLDRKLIGADQTLELQAMGVVLGDLLARDASAKWVVYLDRKGRSRALQMGQSDNFLFPVTMISRRAEAGASVDVEAIYAKADRLMQPYRRPLPFQ